MAYTYKIIEAGNRQTLEKRINELAREGWEAVNAYVVGGKHNADHLALLRRSA